MSEKLEETNNNEAEVDSQKRAFMSKFGKYAIVGAGMATLMTPTTSSADNYRCQTRHSSSHRNKSSSYRRRKRRD